MLDFVRYREQPHLSASSVGDYMDCGLLYKFSRVDRVKPEFRSDALDFGSAIHRTLAEFNKGKMVGNKLLLEEIHETFEKHWRERAEDKSDIQYSEGKDFEAWLLEGKALLTVWYDQLEENEFRVIGVETPFILTLPGLDIPVIGYIDLLEEDESGTLIVTDFKTAGRSYSSEEVDKNLQLTIYHLAAKENGYENREVLLKFDCLIKTKTPKFERFYTSRKETEERRAIKKIREVWKGIYQGIFIPNDGHWKCKNCGFKKHCDEYLEGR